MSNTIVIQSHRQPLPYQWITRCIESVKIWAEQNKFDYLLLGDELFDYISSDLIEKTKKQRVIATDLARLKVLQKYLDLGHETVVWCDADFLIFAPDRFILPNEPYAVGREVWVQTDANSQKLIANIKVHNAFMMYRKANVFLDFYTDTAERLLTSIDGSMPPQFIGPKLLTAIHNVAQCPVLETAGMLSPMVIEDIANQRGSALELFLRKSQLSIAAANLCNSLFESGEYSTKVVENCIDVLFSQELI